MSESFSELLRVDPLTGCNNFLGFLETCLRDAFPDSSKYSPTTDMIESYVLPLSRFSAVLFVEMNHMRFLNETKGRSHGDSAIRWISILLKEENNNDAVYRLGGVEFSILLKLDSHSEHTQFGRSKGRQRQLPTLALSDPRAPATPTSSPLAIVTPTRLNQ